jgi:cytochrome P450
VPRAPGVLPLLGHVVPLLRDPLGFLVSLSACGDVVEVQIGPLFRAVVVCDPELTREVLREDATFDKGGPLFDRAREIAGDGLATCPHSRHRRQRRLAQPAFQHDRLTGYTRAMADEITAVSSGWKDGQVVDVPAEMLRLTMGVGVKTMFASALTPSDLAQAMSDLATVFRGMYRRAVLPPALSRLPSPANRRYQLARGRLRRTVDAIIAERRGSPGDRGDLLSALLAARDPESHGDEALNDAEVADEVMTFFLGGPESTADVIAWALYLVMRHPPIAERLRAEVDSVLAGAPPGTEHISRLELTGDIITETLRLYPPVWMLSRKATADTQLGGYRIPAGTSLFYSPYALHHDGNLFEAPERFDPDRWHGRATVPPRGAFIPFASGPRKCIGDQFGITMATLSLAAITARWHLEPGPGNRPRPATALTLRPRGLRIRVSARPGAAG